MGLAIQIQGLQKSYNVPVLHDFDFDLKEGEVHALVGSNGAGKSTLAKILTGLTPRNGGDIQLFGQPYDPRNKQEAAAAGVIMVLQELNIIPTLTIAENLFLHALPNRGGILDHRCMEDRARDALARVGIQNVDPSDPAASLGVGQQQLVEIAGALAQNSRVLILDEPTAALTGPETDKLFENIERLRSEGVAIIYVSHRMDEISRISDRITVLRDGRRVATHNTTEVDTPQLVREMAGSAIATRSAPVMANANAEIGLKVTNLRAGYAVRGVSFEAHKGEILGIAGLIGCGRTETLRAIFGVDPVESGEIHLEDGNALSHRRSTPESVALGLAMIPEDRKGDGLLLSQTISMNTTLASIDKVSQHGILNHSAEEAAAQDACDQLGVKRDSLDQSVAELSGGNQQKVVIARWLLRDCEVFLFDEPTRGIDVAAKETIYELLDKLAAANKTLVVVSSDLTELMSICHRIVVMSNGQIAGEFTPETWSQEQITAAAFSGYTSNVPSSAA